MKGFLQSTKELLAALSLLAWILAAVSMVVLILLIQKENWILVEAMSDRIRFFAKVGTLLFIGNFVLRMFEERTGCHETD